MIKTKIEVISLVRIAMFSAIICVTSVITVPLPFTAIPITLGLFGILLAGVTLPTKEAMIAVGAFILIGLIGVPVFSSFRGGAGVLVSPTGGYIIGYLPCTLAASLFILLFEKRVSNNTLRFLVRFSGALLGVVLCYAFGLAQFVFITKTPPAAAIAKTILPFILPDAIKTFFAVFLSFRLKNILKFQ
ncbi:MAG: biotin transporter BioY [Oscillospiraceae bacterium]|jgi:biotin transport system substrate-specific component|nr:biotin transporter BioY [Oscillospiraceae bacterium]